jgi:arginase
LQRGTVRTPAVPPLVLWEVRALLASSVYPRISAATRISPHTSLTSLKTNMDTFRRLRGSSVAKLTDTPAAFFTSRPAFRPPVDPPVDLAYLLSGSIDPEEAHRPVPLQGGGHAHPHLDLAPRRPPAGLTPPCRRPLARPGTVPYGIEAKAVVLQQLHSALAIISEHGPARITTVGGECSVSMAPFSYLINKHGDDLAILWIDSHPDMGTGETAYPGFHAMVVSALTGHGDQELLEILPATTTADRVALVGMHDWTDPTLPAIAEEWGLSVFSPEALRSTSAPLLDWPGDTGATKVAIHFDVDTIDADEIQLGLGADLGGLTTAEACRVVADIDSAAEVVALTIAEFIPRQVMHLQQILAGFPLLGPRA